MRMPGESNTTICNSPIVHVTRPPEINCDDNELRIRIVCNFDDSARNLNSSTDVAGMISTKVASSLQHVAGSLRRTLTPAEYGGYDPLIPNTDDDDDSILFTPNIDRKAKAVWNLPFRESIGRLRNRVGGNTTRKKKKSERPEIRKPLFPNERKNWYTKYKVEPPSSLKDRPQVSPQSETKENGSTTPATSTPSPQPPPTATTTTTTKEKRVRKTSRTLGDFFQKSSYREEQRAAAQQSKNIKQIKEDETDKSSSKDANKSETDQNKKAPVSDSKKRPVTPDNNKKQQLDSESSNNKEQTVNNNTKKQQTDAQKLRIESKFGPQKKRNDSKVSNSSSGGSVTAVSDRSSTDTSNVDSTSKKESGKVSSGRFQPDGSLNSNFQSKTAASIAALSARSTATSGASTAPSTTDYQTDESATLTDSTTATRPGESVKSDKSANDVKKLDVKKADSSNSSSSPEHTGTPKVTLRNNSVKRASFKRRSKCDIAETKNLASDFDKIFNRLSMGNSTSSVSDADIKSILNQVEQHQRESMTSLPTSAAEASAKTDDDSKTSTLNKKDIYDEKASAIKSATSPPPTITEKAENKLPVSKTSSTTGTINVKTSLRNLKSINTKNSLKDSSVNSSKIDQDSSGKNTISDKINKDKNETNNNDIVNIKQTSNDAATSNNDSNFKNEKDKSNNQTKVNNTNNLNNVKNNINKDIINNSNNNNKDIISNKNNKDNDNKDINNDNTTTDGNNSNPATRKTSPSTITGTNNINIKLAKRPTSASEKIQKFQESAQKKGVELRREVSATQLRKDTSPRGHSPARKTTDNETEKPAEAAKTAAQTKLEEIAKRREALRKKYLARSHTESSIAIERKERFQRQGFNEGKGSQGEEGNENGQSEPDNVSAEHVLNQIVNRPDALSSSGDDRPNKKKKILLTRSGTETPPAVRKQQGQDVKKILRRLSLNIPPPTPEEIENQNKQGQGVSEEKRKETVLESRKKALENYRGSSTEEKPSQVRRGHSLNLPAGRMDNQRPKSSVDAHELDQIIAKGANDTNLKSFNEKKFNAMRNSLEFPPRSSSIDSTEKKELPSKTISQKVTALVQANVTEKSEKVQKEIAPLRRRHSLCLDRFESSLDSPLMSRRGSGQTDSPLMNRKADYSDPSSRRSFHRNTEWLSTLVDEAVASSPEGVVSLMPKGKESSAPAKPERQKSAISLRDIKQNVDTESIRSALPERKLWLEQVARRNSFKSSGGSLTRSAKTKSLCNLSSLDMDDDMMTLLDLDKPVSRQESVEDIRKSIDLENRGSAYLLPSAIKRRSMNMGEFLQEVAESEKLNNMSEVQPRSRSNTFGGGTSEQRTPVKGHGGETYVDKELGVEYTDEELSEALEAVELPNIQERMKMFQRPESSGCESPFVRKPKLRTINRKQRPKSYAGEHLSQMVCENGVFRQKDDNDQENRDTAASLGKVLMAENASLDNNNNNINSNNTIYNDNNSNEDNVSINNECVNNSKNLKRTNRRSLYANQRILAEIAEMENREAEIMEERKTTTAKIELRRGSAPGHGQNGSTGTAPPAPTEKDKVKATSYPKGLKKFLKENEVRR